MAYYVMTSYNNLQYVLQCLLLLCYWSGIFPDDPEEMVLCQEPHGLGEVKDLDGGADGVVGVRKLGANLIWISWFY